MKTYVGQGAGSKIEMIFSARKTVCVCSPWISPDICERLVKMAESGVQVWVIMGDEMGNAESLETLRDAGIPRKSFFGWFTGKDKPLPNIRPLIIRGKGPNRSYQMLHAKLYLKDDDFAAVGSSNLTSAGLKTNIEYLLTFETPSEVTRIREDFNSLWKIYSSHSAHVITDSDLRAPSRGDRRCFIATAAYGTPFEPKIDVLRGFRDKKLNRNRMGRFLVRAYYLSSPPLALYIYAHPKVMSLVRRLFVERAVRIIQRLCP